MNFYDVLAAEKWGGGIPTINFFDLLFAQSISGEQWQIYEGTLPATLNANGADMKQYQIYGNTGGVGDKTENLFDGYFEQGTTADGIPRESNSHVRSNIITAVAGTFSVDFKNKENFDVAFDFWNGSVLVEATSWLNSKNYITPNNATNVRIKIRKSNNAPFTPAEVIDFGMYSGSTAPASYVPFGYKVDMVSRTRNLLDYSTVQDNLTIDAVTGRPIGYSGRIATLTPIDVSTVSAVTITYNSNHSDILYFMYSVLMADDTMLIRKISKYNGSTIEIPEGGVKLYISWYGAISITTDDITQAMVGANPSDEYQPYSNTTTPIYSGDEPLDKDEYIDYQVGKIYRCPNLLNMNTLETGYLYTDGVLHTPSSASKTTDYMEVAPGEYILSVSRTDNLYSGNPRYINYYNVNKEYLGYADYTPNSILHDASHTFTISNPNIKYAKITLDNSYTKAVFHIKNATPTDPPVPLPALPTCEGTTVIDYAGQSVAPEKVLLEYAKGGN